MNSKNFAVRRRRAVLLAEIAAQRQIVAGVALSWQAPMALADSGLVLIRYLRANPVLVAGVVALLVIRRRGLVGMGMVLWKGWRLYHQTKSFTSRPRDRS